MNEQLNCSSISTDLFTHFWAGVQDLPLDELNEETGCEGETADRGIGLIALFVGRPN